MKLQKIASCTLIVFLALGSVIAQRSETTVEQEYLNSVEDVIVKELAAADDRDSKLVSLQYLELALDSGRVSPDMVYALEMLAGEGSFTQSRTNGRLANNFPDIRAKACDLLAKAKTEESKQILLKVILADNEPMVTTAAIRSLGEIGLNDKNDVLEAISWTEKKYAILNPTSSLALEILNTYEKLAPTATDNTSMIQSISAIATNYNYVTPVRTKALNLLKRLTGR